jgi:hypothetical protein
VVLLDADPSPPSFYSIAFPDFLWRRTAAVIPHTLHPSGRPHCRPDQAAQGELRAAQSDHDRAFVRPQCSARHSLTLWQRLVFSSNHFHRQHHERQRRLCRRVGQALRRGASLLLKKIELTRITVPWPSRRNGYHMELGSLPRRHPQGSACAVYRRASPIAVDPRLSNSACCPPFEWQRGSRIRHCFLDVHAPGPRCLAVGDPAMPPSRAHSRAGGTLSAARSTKEIYLMRKCAEVVHNVNVERRGGIVSSRVLRPFHSPQRASLLLLVCCHRLGRSSSFVAFLSWGEERKMLYATCERRK